MTTKELIKCLKFLDKTGKLKVLLSSDDEGNSYGEVDPQYSFEITKDNLIIYPVKQRLAENIF